MLKVALHKGTVSFLTLVLMMAFTGQLVVSGSSEVHMLFFDDFEGGLAAEWKTFSNFVLADAVAGSIVIGGEKTGAIVGLSDTAWRDYVIEVDIAVDGNVPAGGPFYNCPQIVFRVEDWNNFYLLAFSNSFVRLFKRIDGESTGLLRRGDYHEGIVLGAQPVRAKVEVKGNTIKVSVNGHECINYTDDGKTPTFGGAGVQAWNVPPANAKWIFDDFRVFKIVDN